MSMQDYMRFIDTNQRIDGFYHEINLRSKKSFSYENENHDEIKHKNPNLVNKTDQQNERPKDKDSKRKRKETNVLFICKLCNLETKERLKILAHHQSPPEMCPKRIYFRCDLCDITTQAFIQFDRIHTKNNPNRKCQQCTKCQDLFSKDIILDHESLCNQNRKCCAFCQNRITFHRLDQHMTQCAIQHEKESKCSSCGDISRSRNLKHSEDIDRTLEKDIKFVVQIYDFAFIGIPALDVGVIKNIIAQYDGGFCCQYPVSKFSMFSIKKCVQELLTQCPKCNIQFLKPCNAVLFQKEIESKANKKYLVEHTLTEEQHDLLCLGNKKCMYCKMEFTNQEKERDMIFMGLDKIVPYNKSDSKDVNSNRLSERYCFPSRNHSTICKEFPFQCEYCGLHIAKSQMDKHISYDCADILSFPIKLRKPIGQ